MILQHYITYASHHFLSCRFHAFAFNKLDADVNGNSSYNHDTKAPLGGVPPGAGTREDVVSMWQELEEARAVLGEVQTILEHVPDTRQDGEWSLISYTVE